MKGAHMVHSVTRLREVEGDGGELLAGAALQEQDLVVVRDAHQRAQVCLSLLNDARKLRAPVRKVHSESGIHHTNATEIPLSDALSLMDCPSERILTKHA